MAAVNEIGKRIDALTLEVKRAKQYSTSNTVGANPSFESITIGETGNQVVVDATPPIAPTGLTVTSSAANDNTSITVTWDSASSPGAHHFDVDWGPVSGGTVAVPRTISQIVGNSVTIDGLMPGTQYGVRVYGVNTLGIRSAPAPATGWQTVTGASDTVPPAQVTGLTARSGVGSLMATWTKSTAPDLSRYEVNIATNSTFTANLHQWYEAGEIFVKTDLLSTLSTSTWYVRVRAIDNSGNVGAWSSSYSALPGLVSELWVANAAIGTAKIKDLAVTSAKISSLTADKIATGTLSATTITLGSNGIIRIIGNSGSAGISIKWNGISAYDVGGTQTFLIDSNGNLTMRGSIAASTISGSTISGGTITGSAIEISGYRAALPWISSSPRTEYISIKPQDIYIRSSGGTIAVTAPSIAFWGDGSPGIDNMAIQNGAITGNNIRIVGSQVYLANGAYANSFMGFSASRMDMQFMSGPINVYASGQLLLHGGGNILMEGAVESNGTIKSGANLIAGQQCVPLWDATYALGWSDARWYSVWALYGTIQTSDETLKRDVASSDFGLNFVKKIKPIHYSMGKSVRKRYGFSAQQVKSVIDEMGTDFGGYIDPSFNDDDGPLGLVYTEFIAPAYKAIQELDDKVEKLENLIESNKKEQ